MLLSVIVKTIIVSNPLKFSASHTHLIYPDGVQPDFQRAW